MSQIKQYTHIATFPQVAITDFLVLVYGANGTCLFMKSYWNKWVICLIKNHNSCGLTLYGCLQMLTPPRRDSTLNSEPNTCPEEAWH